MIVINTHAFQTDNPPSGGYGEPVATPGGLSSQLFWSVLALVCCAWSDGAMAHGGAEELEEIVITSTRTHRSFSQQPTRVEVLGAEELNETSNMKPGDIRMLLNESTGIYVQQVSATSFNSSIRIQGLDGKYTQILRTACRFTAASRGG